ncbi:TPA: hypothetical protein OME37_004652 [Klebsiella michiganensis]|nr:hypothetical protein [Klebsiella michiganensis]ELS4625807.1 hypothetical protein [Klebsiella michiganensis]HCQ8476880.1 hypothetical protein [Klebsiella michiganensis]HCU0766835.1 hypothetical protein [Klebsiella michiganensis]HEP0440747.1 hypothetical protein [Klebsiella michiganensis]
MLELKYPIPRITTTISLKAARTLFTLMPQGEPEILASDLVLLDRLCDEIRSRVNPPVKITSHPQRVGSHSCLALHFKGKLCSSIDLLITVNSHLSWPTEDDYHHPRWYMTVVDAADLLYLQLYLAHKLSAKHTK